MPDNEYVMPEMTVSDLVTVRNNPKDPVKAFGWVVAVKTRSVNILLVSAGSLVFFRDCVHETDPRCKTHPQMFDDADRGIFEIAPLATLIRELSERYRVQETYLEKLTTRVSELEEMARHIGEPATPARRKPGRPRKQQLATV